MCTLPFDQCDKPRRAKAFEIAMQVIDVYTPSDISTFRQRRDENVDIALCFKTGFASDMTRFASDIAMRFEWIRI